MQIVKFFKAGCISIVLMGIIVAFVFGCKESDKSEKVISAIKENLPTGTSFTEVESCLKKTHFEYSYNNKTKCFTAILRDVSKGAFASGNISLVIKMDEHDKLKNLEIKKIYTGL